mmetsp:Transcript_5273/g.13714  ORF Transcript_5273/g.13714 Transcript_5273/m.13714 type:complete len:136 (+) Transcript_5273:248-655(+)
MRPILSILFALLLLLAAAAAAQTCSVLDADTCAAACIPYDNGLTAFNCGSTFDKETCCNGTIPQQIGQQVYYDCFCKDEGLTGAAIGLIVGMVILALLGLGLLVWYLRRRNAHLARLDKMEYEKAEFEAKNYLPR